MPNIGMTQVVLFRSPKLAVLSPTKITYKLLKNKRKMTYPHKTASSCY
ncbi:hypothetical protein THIARS_50283 [Thiomonas delicata]|uniref:Uncharacterized protein n=1 Tax=Thiomonas delicata TaxID=364030 RepID=A0A238D1B4_THIDL|nr:hypothetical protein THIARS_50283 [Thiomonas delicata]